jgi:hypothetical protein
MNWKAKNVLVAIGAFVILLACGIGYVFQLDRHTNNYSERTAIDSIIASFLAIRAFSEEGIINGAITTDPDLLLKKWRALKSGYNVSSVVFEKDGEVIFVSENLQRVVVIKPVLDRELSWHCSIIPRVSYETLCSRFPIKIEGKQGK